MSVTAQQIFDRAIARSSLNAAALIPTTETLSWISTYQRKAFLLAAQLNPEYFGKTADTSTRTAFSDSWDITAVPGDVAALMRVKVATITGTVSGVAVGDFLNLINLRWPGLNVSPRAYVRGMKISGHLTELGANNSNMVTKLTLDYAEMPVVLTAMTNSLRLPEEWSHLIEVPLARVFAIRDKREEEAQFLADEYNENLQLFQQAVFVYDAGTPRPLQSYAPTPFFGNAAQPAVGGGR